jgi:hypothetical protein
VRAPAVSGAKIFAGNVTVGNLNNIRVIDGTRFAKTAAGINAADADCVSGTACVIEVNYPGTYSDTKIMLTKSHSLRFWGSGTYTVAGIVVSDSSTDTTALEEIDCPDHATIKLANSANADVVTDANFLTLSGSSNTFGTNLFTLRGCVIDGNKSNQTALATRGTGNINNVTRSAGGVVTLSFSNTPSPAYQVGDTVNIANLTNDSSSFNGRFIVQSVPNGTSITYNQTLRNTVASVGATGTLPTAIGYFGSNGIRIFGRKMKIEDVIIANNVLDGLWTEGYSPVSFSDDTTIVESTFRAIRMANSGGDGWVFWGPQNSQAYDVVEFNHGQWGREIQQPLREIGNVTYLNTSGGTHIMGAGNVQGAADQESAAAGWGILIDSGTGPSTFSSTQAACNGCIGIEFRSASHSYQGLLQNSTTAVKFNGGSAVLQVGMASNTTWFDCTSEVGHPVIQVVNSDGTGTMKGASCWTGNERLFIPPSAGNTTTLQTNTLGGFVIGGWNPTFPSNNGTIAETNLAQTWTAVQTHQAAINFSNLLISNTAPTIAGAGCGGSAASIATNNGTAAFSVGVGTAPTTACTVTLPTATNGWNCYATDITTNSTTVFLQKQSGGSASTAIITNYNDVAVAANFTANDVLQMSCFAR